MFASASTQPGIPYCKLFTAVEKGSPVAKLVQFRDQVG
eukprot:SAG25_NODE_5551_length_645_cov_0.917582_2_plen_37_part_01